MKRPNRLGYTLVEIVVVVLIIGVLAAMAVPQYIRTVETSKADDAAGVVNQIGTTNRMFALDHAGSYVRGAFPSSGACSTTGACPAGAPYNDPCMLVYCGYLANQDWGSKPYSFCACDGASGGACACGGTAFSGTLNRVSAAQRKSAPASGGASSPYNAWGYSMDISGKITGSPTSNGPPAPAF
ncbi:MAG: prepilin-type N-terminal cleavage/methylation domain-containing protein [Elusimicrobia bacterium]|nr:prepilin-type N-terminal cleavage/methylation domain-containing protein [Elusimicrobiota bacterium]